MLPAVNATTILQNRRPVSLALTIALGLPLVGCSDSEPAAVVPEVTVTEEAVVEQDTGDAASGEIATADAQRIEASLDSLANVIAAQYADGATVGTIPAEQPDATTAVPSFHLPAGVVESAETTADKEKLSGILDQFGQVLAANPEVNAVYFGTEHGVMLSYMVPTDLADDYDPRERPWYQDAVAAGGSVVWTEPYVDAFTGGQVISGVKAVYDDSSALVGVVGVDILL